MVERPPTDALVQKIAAFGLHGDWSLSISDAEWRAVLGAVQAQGLTGLASAAADAGALLVTEGRLADLRNAHVTALMRALSIERSLLEISAAARGEDIEHVVLKGPSIAHCFYPDPSWRGFGDLDLLVRGRDWRRACALLDRMGYQRKLPEPRPGFDERFGKAAVHQDERGLAIDLHRTLVLGPFGLWMEPDRLFERTTRFDVAGVPLLRLEDTTLLVHACMHASLGWSPPLFQPVRDVAQIATRGRIDWDDFASLVARWRLNSVVAHAFRTVREVLKIELPSQAAAFADTAVKRSERRALAAYVTEKRGRGGTAVATMRAIPGLGAKAAYLRSMLIPDDAFLTARSRDDAESGSHLRRWVVPVRWALRRNR